MKANFSIKIQKKRLKNLSKLRKIIDIFLHFFFLKKVCVLFTFFTKIISVYTVADKSYKTITFFS